jgi:hypothetical protein
LMMREDQGAEPLPTLAFHELDPTRSAGHTHVPLEETPR